MKIPQLRQIIREEIKGVIKENSENEVARKLLADLQKKFKEGAEIKLLIKSDDPNESDLEFTVEHWPMINAVKLMGEPGVVKIPYTKKDIEFYNLTVDGEPIDLTVFDATTPSSGGSGPVIKGVEYDPYSYMGLRGGIR